MVSLTNIHLHLFDGVTYQYSSPLVQSNTEKSTELENTRLWRYTYIPVLKISRLSTMD